MSAVYTRRSGAKRSYPLAAAAVLLACNPVFLTAGFAVPFAAADGTSKFVGITTFDADNTTGANGEIKVEVQHQECSLLNSGDIDETHVGETVYFTDDATVSSDSSTHSRPIAGVVTELDDNLVWVKPAVV